MNATNKIYANVKVGVFGTLLALVLILFSCANIFHFPAHMDSDVAAEAILAKEISDNHLKTPDTWVISTETRYIYPANLAAPIYSLTGNMQLSMGLAATIYGLILVLCMFLLYKRIGLSTEAGLIAILIPFVVSVNIHDYLEMFFLYAGYYLPVMVSFYVTLYVYVILGEKKSRISAIIPGILLSIVLSDLLGAQGMRGVLMTYLPILSAHILKCVTWKLRKRPMEKRLLLITIWLLFLTLLSTLDCLRNDSGVADTTRNIRHAFEKFFSEVVPSVAELFTRNSNVLLVVLAAVVTIGTLFYSINLLFFSRSFSDEGKWIAATSLWAGGFVMVAAMTFTTFEVAPRYGLYFLFAAGMAAGLLIDRLKEREGESEKTIRGIPVKAMSYAVVAVVVLCSVVSFTVNYIHLIKNDRSSNSSYCEIAAWMQEKGTDIGYAVFDYAGSMTVTCNGSVNVYPVNNMTDMEGCKWLSNSDWYPPFEDSGRSVVIITTDATDSDFNTFMSGNEAIKILDTTRISRFNCYLLESDPVRWVE